MSIRELSIAQERKVLRAFRESVQSVKNQAVIQQIVNLLEVGNVQGVIDLLQLDEQMFEPLEESIRQAYREGGLFGANQIGAVPAQVGALVLRFNVRNIRAEKWLKDLSSRLIVEIAEDQKAMVRERLTEGLTRGDNPRRTALDLIGRIDSSTKKRTGGFLGLTQRQAKWISNARDQLESLDDDYLNRKLRDKRYDKMVMRAIKSGKPLDQRRINTIIASMQNRTLKYRSDNIARTESINALRAGQHEAMVQAVELGELSADDIKKSWDATGDARTREDHVIMENMYKDGIVLTEPFIAPDGSLLNFPGDSELGAAGDQTIQCRCKAKYVINFLGRIKRIEGFS